MPTAVPPRTSSSRRTQPSERSADSSRRTHADSSRDANGRIDPSEQSSRNRRTTQSSQDQYGANGARDARGNPSTTAPVRSPPPNAHSTNGPSREASEILNSILISQPEVDIEREKERLALAQPHQDAGLQDDDAAAPPVVAMADPADETRRGGRSRHDHTRREKQTKFGEFILGNTIGEGEFGKVKLGWRQEGGVQVRCPPELPNLLAPLTMPSGRHQTHQKGPAGRKPLTYGQDHARGGHLEAVNTPQYCPAP